MFLVRFLLAAILACLMRAVVLPCPVTLSSKHGSVTNQPATNCTFYFKVAKNQSLTIKINTNRNFTFPYWENVSANSSLFAQANGSCVTFRWSGSTCGPSQCNDVIEPGSITSSQVGITFAESPSNETIRFSYKVTECPRPPPMTTTKPDTAPNDAIIAIGVGVAAGVLFLLLLIVMVTRILLKKKRKVTPTNDANHRDTTEGNISRNETVEITEMPPPDPDVPMVKIEPQEAAVQQATYINVKEAIYVNEHVTDDDVADSDNAGFYEEPIPMTSRANGQEDPTYMNMRDLS